MEQYGDSISKLLINLTSILVDARPKIHSEDELAEHYAVMAFYFKNITDFRKKQPVLVSKKISLCKYGTQIDNFEELDKKGLSDREVYQRLTDINNIIMDEIR